MSRPVSTSESVQPSPRRSNMLAAHTNGGAQRPLPESMRIRLLPVGEPDGAERIYPTEPVSMFGWLRVPLVAVMLLFAVCGTMIALSWNSLNVTPPLAADKPTPTSSATPASTADKTKSPRPVRTVPPPVRPASQPPAMIVPVNAEPSATAEPISEPEPSQEPTSPESPVPPPATSTSPAPEQTSEQPPTSPEETETTSASTAPANPEPSTQPSEATTS